MASKKIWVSHSSIIDFNNCSRLYYFKNIYRNPKTENRVQLVNPYLSLGSAVHDALDCAVNLYPSGRKKFPLLRKYERIWKNYTGKKGGFLFEKQEKEFKKRGAKMLKKVEKSSLYKKRSLRKEKELPKAVLFRGVELVGSLDWVEVLKNGNLHIIDFKTGRSEERKNSWQLPIYQILAQKNYGKNVDKLSYWYLEKSKGLISKKTINTEDFILKIKEKALEIKTTIEKRNFSCNSYYDRCYWCRGYEGIISGKAEHVGFDEKMRKDLYFMPNGGDVLKKIKEGDFLSEFEKEILEIRLGNEDVGKIQEKNKITKKNIGVAIFEIKRKIKENLNGEELSLFIRELEKNGRQMNF